MEIFEYNLINYSYTFDKELINEINSHGKLGWEIIHYKVKDSFNSSNFKTSVTILFKRKKIQHIDNHE